MNKIKNSWDYFWLAAYAFLGLGMEMVVLLIEQPVYGISMNDFNTWQMCLHWIITCTIWMMFTFRLLKVSKIKYDFDVMAFQEKPSTRNILIAIILVAIGIVAMSISWDGFKPFMEAAKKTPIIFIFQYIYYLFEVALYFLIIIFGQKFCETLFHNEKIPWGGFLLALTWGLIHILTKDLATGIESAFMAIVYGIIYLLLKKNYKLSYIFIACIFLL